MTQIFFTFDGTNFQSPRPNNPSPLFQQSTENVTESVDQHKYSRLADTSYYFEDQEKAREILDNLEETRNFQLDDELSSNNASVYHHQDTGEVVLAFRGTSINRERRGHGRVDSTG